MADILKEQCTPKEWNTCRVEKMGCDGCHYIDVTLNEKEKIFKYYLNKLFDEYAHHNVENDILSSSFNEYGLNSFLVRIEDQLNYCKKFISSDNITIENKTIDDILLDLAKYTIIGLTEIEFKKKMLLSD